MPDSKSQPHGPDYNLLFAGLGLTLGILNRDKVIRGFTEWILDKELPIGEIFIQQKAISKEEKSIIDQAIKIQIDKEGSEKQALASVAIIKDIDSDLKHLKDSDIKKSMSNFGKVNEERLKNKENAYRTKIELDFNQTVDRVESKDSDFDPYSTKIPDSDETKQPKESRDRFQRKEFLDAGSLGEVWFAKDTELNRTVVIKYIKQENSDNLLNKALFHLEGEVTGFLEHPNIAPVYGLGKDTLDRNFYAMRYIKGKKLTHKINEYHLNFKNKNEILIELLQNFQSACLAIEYAHSHGVIHCDIKPDNIMVGQFGETMVVDWGLVLVKRDSAFPDLGNLKKNLKDVVKGENQFYQPSASASGGLHEKQGGIRDYVGGTPAYMAPEQVRATRGDNIDGVTALSDVFGLGAVLYEILTDQAPLIPDRKKKETRTDYFQRIENGIFPPPGKIKSGIPKGLEAIVIKAMSFDPKDRYISARELADDVKRWVSDEPTIAYREKAPEKLYRWIRKNKLYSGLIFLSLFFFFIGSILFSVLVYEHNKELQISEAKAKESELIALKERDYSDKLNYSSNISLAQISWNDGNINNLKKLLEKQPRKNRGWEHDYLWTNLNSNQKNLKGHSGLVKMVSWSPDGKKILSASFDKKIKIWDPINGNEILTFSGHDDLIFCASWNPEGNLVASSGKDKNLKIWKSINGQILLNIPCHSDIVQCVSWSPDGKNLLTCSCDNTAKLWDASNGKPLLTINGHIRPINWVCWSPDGKRFITCSDDNTAMVWDSVTGKELLDIGGHTENINAACFSPDGNRFVTCSDDKTAKIWDASIGKEILTLNGHSWGVNSVSWSPDGNWILTGSDDRTAIIWDAKSGKKFNTFRGHGENIHCVSWSPDGKRVLTGAGDDLVKIWDWDKTQGETVIKCHIGDVCSSSWSFDGNRVLTCGEDGFARIWNWKEKKEIVSLKGHIGKVICVCWSSDGKKVLTGGVDETIRLWDSETGKQIFSKKNDHGCPVFAVCFSPDGKKFASSFGNNLVKVWDIQNANEILTLTGHLGFVYCVSWSPDGTKILTGGNDKKAIVWKSEDGSRKLTLEGHESIIKSVCWNLKGDKIFTASYDNTAKIWDSISGIELQTLVGHNDFLNHISLSADGYRICTSSLDKTVKIWDSQSYIEVFTISGNDAPVRSASWSPDGKYLLASFENSIFKIWDGSLKQNSFPLARQSEEYAGVCWSLDGKHILARSSSGKTFSWNASTLEIELFSDFSFSKFENTSYSFDKNKVVYIDKNCVYFKYLTD